MVVLFSCRDEYIDKPFFEINYTTISEFVDSEDLFSLFKTLIMEGGLHSSLSAYNPYGSGYTLFLPTNSAVNQFIEESDKYSNFQDLLNDIEFVKILVRYHVANIAMNANDFPFGALPDTTLSGDLLTIMYTGDIGSLVQEVNNDARIIYPNIFLTNGYIHIIDKVLEPVTNNSFEWLKNNADFSIFTKALEITKLCDTFNISSATSISSSTLLVETDDSIPAKRDFLH
jgi:uncharacterized surface protein with fasciclin (FAS1) repeats